MLFETKRAAFADRDTALLPCTFRFDWVMEQYDMTEGEPTRVSDIEAVKAWLELVLRTRRGRYRIYPPDFGCSFLDLRGRKIPYGTSLPELQRELEQSAAYFDLIDSVSGVEYDEGTVRCTVVLTKTQQEEEVVIVEP